MLFMGIAMSITAFPVLARILAERNLIRTKLGSIALACAAADDVTAWCLLALVVSVVHAKGPGRGADHDFGSAGVRFRDAADRAPAPGPLGGAHHHPGKPDAERGRVHLRAALDVRADQRADRIHALFGAFLFGTIMPRQGDYAHALAERLEDFVIVALLPLFFAYSGLRTELGFAREPERLAAVRLFDRRRLHRQIRRQLLRGAAHRHEHARFGSARRADEHARLMELIVLNVGLD